MPTYRERNTGQEVITDAVREDLEQAARWEKISDGGEFAIPDYPNEPRGGAFLSSDHVGGPTGYEVTGGVTHLTSATAGIIPPAFIQSHEYDDAYKAWSIRVAKPLDEIDTLAEEPGLAASDKDQAKFEEKAADLIEASEDSSNNKPSDTTDPVPPTGEQGVAQSFDGPRNITEPPRSGKGAGRNEWAEWVTSPLGLNRPVEEVESLTRAEIIEKFGSSSESAE